MMPSNSIEESGFFWTPEKPGKRFPGILRISDSGEITLKMTSLSNLKPGERSFGDEFFTDTPSGFDRIIGITKSGDITLEGCRENRWESSIQGITSISISARVAFVGVGYGKGGSITFSTFRFSIEGLDEWLSITGSQTEYKFEDDNFHITINFSPPGKIEIYLPNQKMHLEFGFNFSLPMGFNVTETKITQRAYISLKSDELRPLDNFLTVASIIIHFLCFVIGETVSMTSATGYSKEVVRGTTTDEKSQEIPIEIFSDAMSYLKKSSTIDRNKMLLSFKDIQDHIQDIFVNWLRGYQKFKPAFDLYFAYEAGKHRDLESQFLILVQSLEAMHRRQSQEKTMPDDEFEDIKRSVLEIVPKRRRSWMENRIQYANELSLRKRLTRMIEPFREFYGSNKERGHFIKEVVDMRNQLIHSDPEISKPSSDIKKMFVLCQKLQSLLQLHLLKIMGMSDERIKEIIKEKDTLRDNLELSESDVSVY